MGNCFFYPTIISADELSESKKKSPIYIPNILYILSAFISALLFYAAQCAPLVVLSEA